MGFGTGGSISRTPQSVEGFDTERQAALATDLERALIERGIITPVVADARPAVVVTVQFIKTEHFADKQDNLLDVLLTARIGEKYHERVHHISTFEGSRRLLQSAEGSRQRAGKMLLAAMTTDVNTWLTSTAAVPSDGVRLSLSFDACLDQIINFLSKYCERPVVTWREKVHLRKYRSSDSSAVLELQWLSVKGFPPFCLVDIYADGTGTRIVIHERDRPTVEKAGAAAADALREFIRAELQNTPFPAQTTSR